MIYSNLITLTPLLLSNPLRIIPMLKVTVKEKLVSQNGGTLTPQSA